MVTLEALILLNIAVLCVSPYSLIVSKSRLNEKPRWFAIFGLTGNYTASYAYSNGRCDNLTPRYVSCVVCSLISFVFVCVSAHVSFGRKRLGVCELWSVAIEIALASVGIPPFCRVTTGSLPRMRWVVKRRHANWAPPPAVKMSFCDVSYTQTLAVSWGNVLLRLRRGVFVTTPFLTLPHRILPLSTHT